MGIGLTIFLYLIGLFITYVIIETAVRKGIDSSLIGKYLEEKYNINEKSKSFLDDDLD